jgi:hypothetical protein
MSTLSNAESILYSNLIDMLDRRWKFLCLQLQTTVALSGPGQSTGKHQFAVITDLDGSLSSDHPISKVGSNVGSTIFPNAKMFMELCKKLDVSLFIVTARTSLPQVYALFEQNGINQSRVDQLVKKIYVRPSEASDIATSKRAQRDIIRYHGYELLLVLGDNQADLDLESGENINVLFDNPFLRT